MERSTGTINLEHYIICLAAAIQSFLSDTILHVWSNCLLISELFFTRQGIKLMPEGVNKCCFIFLPERMITGTNNSVLWGFS